MKTMTKEKETEICARCINPTIKPIACQDADLMIHWPDSNHSLPMKRKSTEKDEGPADKKTKPETRIPLGSGAFSTANLQTQIEEEIGTANKGPSFWQMMSLPVKCRDFTCTHVKILDSLCPTRKELIGRSAQLHGEIAKSWAVRKIYNKKFTDYVNLHHSKETTV
jgi:hypothetical protein